MKNPINLHGPELKYSRALLLVADQVEALLAGYNGSNIDRIGQRLDSYADILDDWAAHVARGMFADVDTKNRRFWRSMSQEIGVQMARQLAETDIGVTVTQSLDAQVQLIKSLPRHAAEQAHEYVREAALKGQRASDIADRIMALGGITRRRAVLIARTETSRFSTELLKARAQTVGSTGYTWRTASDSDVRPSHKFMSGRHVLWGSPPTLDGMTGHAGCLPHCRCYPEPVIPD